MKKIYKGNWLFKLKMLALGGAMLFAGSAMAQLSGTYTINAGSTTSGSNFASFTDFSSAINTRGVSGNVTVNVVANSGPYTGQNLVLNGVGSSSATITINGNADTLSGTGSVVELDGADYVTVSNLVIVNTSAASGARGVWFHNAADNNTITGCQIVFTAYKGTSNSTGYIIGSGSASFSSSSSSPHGSNNTFIGNTMKSTAADVGPYYGVAINNSTSTSLRATNNVIRDNDISGVYYFFTYMYGNNDFTINSNKMHDDRSNANYVYAVYTGYGNVSNGVSIDSNEVYDMTPNTRFYMAYTYQVNGTSSKDYSVSNNKVHDITLGSSGDMSGILCYYSDYGMIDKNTFDEIDAGGELYYGLVSYYSDYATFSNNEWTNGFYDGRYGFYYAMYNYRSNFTDFVSNKFTDNITDGSYGAYYAFYLDRANDSKFQDNIINENTFEGTSYGVYYLFRAYYSNRCEVVGNQVNENTIDGGTYGAFYTFYNYYGSTDFLNNEFKSNDLIASFYNWFYMFYNFRAGDVVGNVLDDNSGTGNYMYYTIYNYYGSNNNVSYNEITNNSSTYFYYVVREYYGSYNKIEGNLVSGNTATYFGYVFYMYYSDGWQLTNNVIANNTVSSGMPYIIYNYNYNSTYDNLIAHNTINLTGSNGYYYGMYIYNYNGSDDCAVQNNIFDFTPSNTSGTVIPIYGNAGSGDWKWSHNVLNTTDFSYHYWNGTQQSTDVALLNSAEGTGFPTSKNDFPVTFVDAANDDFRVASFGLCNAGTPVGVANDFMGSARSTTTPDVGALEFFLDVDVESIDITTNTSECGNFTTPLGITFTNETAYPVSNIPVGYSGAGFSHSETIKGPIGADSTVVYTFSEQPVFNEPGTNVVSTYLDEVDDVAANNEQSHTFNIVASPSGGDLTASATVFEGYANAGTMLDPDVTVNTYELEYDITRPSKYSGQAPGTDYTYTMRATSMGGTSFGAADGFSVNGEIVEVDPSTALSDSTILFEVVVADVNTGCDTALAKYLYVPHTPQMAFDASDVCLGDLAEFKNNTTLEGNDYMLHAWEFDDPDATVTNDNSDIKDGFYNYTTYGTADVELTSWNGVYPKFKYTLSKTITITPKPELDFKVINACEGTGIQFNNNSSLPIAGSIGYSWDFGDGNNSTMESPTHRYSSPGQRVVTLTGVANGCAAMLSKNAYQFEKPDADFSTIGACNFEDIEFVNNSTILNDAKMGYSWDFGDGGISRQEAPMHAFSTAGSKTVTLKATSEFGCEDTYSTSITLAESPEADFEWDAACNLTPVQFTRTGSVPGDGSGSSYSWDFSGMGTSTDENPNHLFSEIGPKDVTLTINDLNGCSSSITKELNVVLQAVAQFEAADVCEGSDAVFTNKSTVAAGNLDYVWNFGDPSSTTSTDLSPRFAYPVTGQTRIINVTLQANVPGGCSDEITKSLTVNATPDASFTANVQGRSVVITGPAGNDIYQWTFGDGGKSTDQDPVYTYTNVDQGTFEVCLGTRNAECWSENCETVTINLVGIEDLVVNNAMVNVYPNPTAGAFTLEVSDAREDVVIKIADILGNNISFDVEDNLNGKYAINLDAVANGVYFVQVKNGDFYATKRITVNK